MSAVLETIDNDMSEASTSSDLDIIVVGSGPVGIYFINQLMQRLQDTSTATIKVFGGEPWKPYNRVRLTDVLSGKATQGSLFESEKLPDLPNITKYWNNPIQEINRHERYVIDSNGDKHSYKKLVLALGSDARVPSIKGTDLENVFTFRNLDEAQALIGRQVGSRKTVIIGGGILGIEAAKAMQRFNTEVFCIEHSTRLMFSQLDDDASTYLEEYLNEQNIQTRINQRVLEITADDFNQSKVSGVKLASGEFIECDTVIISTGIIPNVKLARDSGIRIGRGIRVDNQLETNIPSIYAIGECAEHNDQIYGLAAPGFEQASILAENLNGGEAQYLGSTSIAQLKVLNFPVFSMGETGDNVSSNKEYIYSDPENKIYRKLVIVNNRIKGVVALGEWTGRHRIQDAIENKRHIWFWKPPSFRSSGELWDEEESDVINWPAEAIVCNCMRVNRGQLSSAINNGCENLEQLCNKTCAGTVCGSCKPLLHQLVESNEPMEAETGSKWLWGTSIVGALLLAIFFILPAFPFSKSLESPFSLLDSLWQTTFYKQVSGFTLLGLSVAALLISLRKRVAKFTWGIFPYWRIAHVILGFLTLVVIFLHTGFRLGNELNFILATTFSCLLLVGIVASALIAKEHQLTQQFSQRLLLRVRKMSILTHILLFWPIPALLGFHILKSYYF